MELEQGYRHANMGFPLQPYQHNGRNPALAVPDGTRANPRVCPMRGPIDSARLHVHGDDGETVQSRRRVAVACARCRKRKIRCSGDPGNGTGCHNCKSAGVALGHCAFHRVGSGEATSMIDLHNNLNQIANSHQTMMQIYNDPASPIRSRPLTYQPGLDTKSILAPGWYSSPYNSEETSPVEAYGLDHPGAYLPNQTPITYTGSYGFGSDNKPAMNNYLGRDSHMYPTHGLPFSQHNIRNVASSDALSHSITSPQLTLPERPHTRSDLPISHRPQLPIPLPSPAQTCRNAVDQLQDQRLRSVQAVSGSTIGNRGFMKPSLPFDGDIEVHVTTSNEALPTHVTSSATAPSTDPALSYSSAIHTASDETPISSAPHFDFSTSPLFEGIPALTQPTYSNLRDSQDCKSTTSSSTKIVAPMDRRSSQNDFYSVGNNSNYNGLPDGNDSMLVSGNHYTPLGQPTSQAQHQGSLKSTSNKSTFPVPCASSATLNRGF